MIQPFQAINMAMESAFTSFHSISVPPKFYAEKHFNKIRSQKLEWNVFPDGRLFTASCLGGIRWFWQVMYLLCPAGYVWIIVWHHKIAKLWAGYSDEILLRKFGLRSLQIKPSLLWLLKVFEILIKKNRYLEIQSKTIFDSQLQ